MQPGRYAFKQCRIGKRDCHYDESPQKKKTTKKERSAGSIDAGSSDKGSNGVAPGLAHIGATSSPTVTSTRPIPIMRRGCPRSPRLDRKQRRCHLLDAFPVAACSRCRSFVDDHRQHMGQPFALWPGPHGETHPTTHQVPTHSDGYGWPSKPGARPDPATASCGLRRSLGTTAMQPTGANIPLPTHPAPTSSRCRNRRAVLSR